MYIPKHFSSEDTDRANEIARDNAFGLLISYGASFEVSHLPMLLVDDGSEYGSLIGHVAKPNPHGALFDGKTPAVAVFSGPHAYISPRWYVSPELVPTWNYAAVHVHGRPGAVTDNVRAQDILRQLVDAFEPEENPWSMDDLPDGRLAGQMKGIVAFAMPVERVEVKFKMNQNKKPEDNAGVIEALSGSGHEGDRAVAGMMKSLLG